MFGLSPKFIFKYILRLLAINKLTRTIEKSQTEMQKAASMASVLVLIFIPAVLIFGLPARKI